MGEGLWWCNVAFSECLKRSEVWLMAGYGDPRLDLHRGDGWVGGVRVSL
jgi:hypothetical protein